MASIRLDASRQYYPTSSLVVGYALCSSLLAVINKFANTKFNYPGLLTALQYLTSALGVWILGKLGFLHHDALTLDTAKKFLPAAFVFYLAIFTNTNLLRHANVDTFIVFRSLTPLLVAVADTAFRKQPCPSKLTFLSLVIILSGTVGKAISATAFTVTGVVNKFLTVSLNVLIWDKHASPFGLVCLLLTVAGGILYQQSVTGAGNASNQRESAALKQMETKNEDGNGYAIEDEGQGISGKFSGV